MDPLSEYVSRKKRREEDEAKLKQLFLRIGNARLGAAVLAIVLAWLSFGRHLFSAWSLLLPFVIFVGLIVWHQQVIRRRTLMSRAVRFYAAALDRLEDRWMGHGTTGEEFRDPAHVYADDLDIFGKGSLFELVSRARTGPGERTLANWFLSPAARDEAHARQEAVAELQDRLDLREEVALLGEDVRSGVHPEQVAAWGSASPIPLSPVLRPLAFVLSIGAAITCLLFFGQILPLWPFLVLLASNGVLIYILRERVHRIMETIETPAQDLQILSLVLARLEQERFACPWLNGVHHALEIEGHAASNRIAKLGKWMELLDSSDHLLLKVLHPVILWQEQCALAVEAWRSKNGPHVGRWLQAVGNFEAISSLASLSFERPLWANPTLLDGDAQFRSGALEHPLLSKCVPNDIAIGGDLRLLIISGSNMSGKSTLLRAIGLNTVLAWAGAPVAASRMTVSPLSVGASLRAIDSLQDNRSRFFAEITRLRQIVDLTKLSRPVLFLLDELLSGTNSHDRRIGASAIVRNLVQAGAIGLITTHDLALAEIEQDLRPRAVNAHFEDTIVDGRVEFDYRLRGGIVTRSNALELMRAIGLAV